MGTNDLLVSSMEGGGGGIAGVVARLREELGCADPKETDTERQVVLARMGWLGDRSGRAE